MSKKVIVKILTYLSDHSQTVVIFVLLPYVRSETRANSDKTKSTNPIDHIF